MLSITDVSPQIFQKFLKNVDLLHCGRILPELNLSSF